MSALATLRGFLDGLVEAGKRNNQSDQATIQAIHDQSAMLGATCPQDSTEPDGDDFSRSQPMGSTKEAAKPTEGEPLTERQFTDDERKALAKSGAAMDDGGYPIENESDLKNAVQAFGRAKDKAATKAHIVKRAKALGATDLLPPDWDGSTQKTESAVPLELAGDLVPLDEAGVIRRDGTAPVKIISPGVGSSGYYSPEVLERDAAKFAGASCYWDHPKVSDEHDRPERSLRDLAGKIVGTPTWDANGKTGPGIYADVQVFKPYQESVEELARHIGMSIRATGKATHGEIGGRKMPIIEGIEAVKSVDFVTIAGRGGEILQLFEAARGGVGTPEPATQKGTDDPMSMDLQEAQAALAEAERKLTEATAQTARLNEALILRDAFDFARVELGKIDMPELSRARIAESLAREPIVKDGKLDQDAFRAKLRETAKVELQYLEAVTGRGMIRGMGSAKTANAQEAIDRTAAAFRTLGLSETSALAAAKGRGH